ncbi:MAG: putative isomerase [Clostridiales bacterium]|jgi:PhzF family phenazine biosynthesis protein|nr:putative isomerase [Clostridiales bacterium]
MKQYVVDAFSDKVFGGNPAAVCVMDQWLSDELMMNITIENNLSDTAFAVKEKDKYKLRWFTPGGEVDLCGHATLACAYIIFNYVETDLQRVVFSTMSGDLIVNKYDDLYELDLPAYDLRKAEITQEMIEAIGATPIEAYLGRDLLCIFDNEDTIRYMKPNMDKLKQIDGLLLQVTAAGREVDCVSRSFAPKLSILEDPVCGSGHCHIAPYWINKLNKQQIVAYQASKRGGTLYCSMEKDRVKLSGKASLYSIADINIG